MDSYLHADKFLRERREWKRERIIQINLDKSFIFARDKYNFGDVILQILQNCNISIYEKMLVIYDLIVFSGSFPNHPEINYGVLNLSCKTHHLESIKLFLVSCNVKFIDYRVFDRACENQDIIIVKLLLADDRLEKIGQDAIVSVCRNGDIGIAKLLLEDDRLTYVDSLAFEETCGITNHNGYEIAKLLLEHDKLRRINFDEALRRACRSGNFSIVGMLLENSGLSHVGYFALNEACKNRHFAIVAKLLESDKLITIDPFILEKACVSGHLPIIQLLLESDKLLKISPKSLENAYEFLVKESGESKMIVELLLRDKRLSEINLRILKIVWERNDVEIAKRLLGDDRMSNITGYFKELSYMARSKDMKLLVMNEYLKYSNLSKK